jgi:hypothetical protein
MYINYNRLLNKAHLLWGKSFGPGRSFEDQAKVPGGLQRPDKNEKPTMQKPVSLGRSVNKEVS